MARLLAIFTLVVAIVLFPPAVLALISNNAVPGDATYPIKRGLEEVILKVASVNPTTKAWFSIERSGRRFEEAKVLLTTGKSGSDSSLNELVSQTEAVSRQIATISDPVKKQELKEKLSQEIKKYDKGLEKVKQEIAQTTPTPAPQITATANPTSTPTPVPAATVTPTLRPRSSPSVRPSFVPTIPSASPTVQPTATPVPYGTPYATPYTSPYPTPSNVSDCDLIKDPIAKAQCRLQFIDQGLSALSTGGINIPTPSSTPASFFPQKSSDTINSQDKEEHSGNNSDHKDKNKKKNKSGKDN